MRETMRALFLLGPTASGKTSLALEVADRTGAEIVSCDSRQIYRDMTIGTAAPSAAERARVPHYLVEVVSPRERWSAGRWADEAAITLRHLAERNVPALIVGGSGLYARALRSGLADLPTDRALRRTIEAEWADDPPERLHERLARLDPDAARGIHPHNRVRVLRAIEVSLLAGRPISRLWAERRRDAPRFPARLVAVRRARRVLHERIHTRTRNMVEAGLLDEVRALAEAGFSSAWPSYRTLGYPDALACVEGRATREATITSIAKQTRAYAKRQETWLGGEADAEWLDLAPDGTGGAGEATAWVARCLEQSVVPLDALAPAG